MKRFKFNKPLRVNETNLDELFDDDADDWKLKAERMLRRRERRLRNQMLQY